MSDIIHNTLTENELESRLEAIEFAYSLVEVVLTNGDIILGGLYRQQRENASTISIRYNGPNGKPFGTSYIAVIPKSIIAELRVFPISEDTTPLPQVDEETRSLFISIGAEKLLPSKLSVWDYPNPLAKIIYEINSKNTEAHEIEVWGYTEKAFSEESVPPEGIKLNKEYLIYADWDFFSQTTKGGLEVSAGITGILNIAKNISSSQYEIVLRHLQGKIPQRATKNSLINEKRLKGYVFVEKEPQDTIIQGEKCVVIMCANASKPNMGELIPTIIKHRYLNYPFELLTYIISQLTFFGEETQIPLVISGVPYNKVLLARAIAYLND